MLASTDILILSLKVLSEIICNDIFSQKFSVALYFLYKDQELFIGRVGGYPDFLQWDIRLPALTGFPPLHKLYMPSSHSSPSCSPAFAHTFSPLLSSFPIYNLC